MQLWFSVAVILYLTTESCCLSIIPALPAVPVNTDALPTNGGSPLALPSAVPELPVAVPELPVAVPELPVAVPDLPVAVPELPLAVPELPVAVPELPVAVPDLPVTVPELPATASIPDLPLAVPDLPVDIPLAVPDLPVEVPNLPIVGVPNLPCVPVTNTIPDLNNLLSGIPGLSQLSSVGDLLSTLPGLGNLLTALPTLGGLPGLLSNLTSALTSTSGLGNLLQSVLSVLNTILASISTVTGLPYGNIVSSIPLLRPLLNGLAINLPQLSAQGGTGASAKLPCGLKLDGRGGLTELLNTVLDFLSGLFVATPKLLAGLPLNQILSGLPSLNGILPNSIPSVPVAPSLPVSTAPISSVLDGNTCGRCGALIDIHNNEINGLKIVLG
ncbi:elastin-like isoform X2 [Bradysia coprophila]|uniref:elastin-like isoform X2 n=1 Tax=Bradysia coprophila TaxID=38358 RepID=UPI00187D7D0F|nr:elastin-like isoform X2 [Bradysia coprophila]